MTNTSFFTVFNLYDEKEATQIFDLVIGREWEPGKARTPELTDQLKHNLELKMVGAKKGEKDLMTEILKNHAKRLADNTDIKTLHIVKGVSPPKFNRYVAPGGDYRRHTDSPVMAGVRTDLACTTFLSNPEDCDGGELNIEDHYGNVHSFKGERGQCVVYPCGQPHWVSPVTRGERVSIVCWMQSYIRDIHKRQLLSGMIKSLSKIEEMAGQDQVIRDVWTEMGSTHAALFKMWME